MTTMIIGLLDYWIIGSTETYIQLCFALSYVLPCFYAFVVPFLSTLFHFITANHFSLNTYRGQLLFGCICDFQLLHRP